MSLVKQAEELVDTVTKAKIISDQYPIPNETPRGPESKLARRMRWALQGNDTELV